MNILVFLTNLTIICIRYAITKEFKNWFITNNEILTAIDQYSATTASLKGTKWSPYQITKNGFSLYYKRSFVDKQLILELCISIGVISRG